MNIINSRLKFKGELLDRKKTEEIILHHAECGECTVYDIHIWHLCRGWSGCGYHYFIKKNGDIYDGRDDQKIGAHCKGKNSSSIGICFEGDFMKEEPSKEQIKSALSLCEHLNKKYGVLKVFSHKEINDTDCPGDKFSVDNFREKMEENSIKLDVLELQRFLNSQGIKDFEGKKLEEDGIIGRRTRYAFERIKSVEL